jgi:hypothetical protein
LVFSVQWTYLQVVIPKKFTNYEDIAENAAKGLFPTDRPVLSAGYDYPLLAKRLQVRSKLIREKKAATKASFLKRG